MVNTEKKKVLIFVPEFPVFSETFIEREISKLVEWGNLNIKVFALKEGKNQTSEAVKDITTYHKGNILDAILAIPYGLFRIPRLIKAFKLVKNNPNRNIIQTKYLFLKAWAYARIWSKFDPDIVYAHFMSESSTVSYIASVIMDTDFAISAHAKDVLVTNSPLKYENAELVPQKVDRAKFITICNKHAYDKAVELSKRADPKNIHLIYHGVDFGKLINWGIESIEKPDVPLIFTNGRFTEKKGHKYLIEASKIIQERGFGHIVYIFGAPGDKYDETVAYAKEMGVEENVKFIGEGKGLTFDKVLPYYIIADVYAFPAVNLGSGDSDGIATTLIEACVFKIPIVATDAGSTLELVSNEETGLIVPQHNSYELANALERLIVDKEYGNKLATAAHEKARNMFDINRNVGKIQDLLLE